MRIGILTYRQYPYVSANTAIGYEVGEALSKDYNHEVIYIGRRQDASQDKVYSYKGNKIQFLNKKIESFRVQRIKNIAKRYCGENLFFSADARALKKIVKLEKIDALICVIAPIDDARIVKKAKLDIPCILYQLDPFYHQGDLVNKKKKQEFLKSLKAFNGVCTTKLLMQEYRADKEFIKVLDKFKVVEFPLLKPLSQSMLLRQKQNRVRLLYAGSFYHKIRSPQILIKLRYLLPDDCQLVFCGGCDDEADFQSLVEGGIVCKGMLLPDQLIEEYQKADILINIGNSISNQMGSKLIGYIATGKPILNIMQIEDCTKGVLKDYPFAFNVLYAKFGEQKDALINFIDKNKRSIAEYCEIEKNYIAYTPKYVAKQILDMFNKK